MGEEESDLQSAAKEMRDHLWTDSLWQTYQESIEVIVPNADDPTGPGHRITRKISLGMSVKSDNRAPAKILQYSLSKALNVLMEEEKERWLDSKAMELEIDKIKRRFDNDSSSRDNITGTDAPTSGVHTDTQAGDKSESTPDNQSG